MSISNEVYYHYSDPEYFFTDYETFLTNHCVFFQLNLFFFIYKTPNQMNQSTHSPTS